MLKLQRFQQRLHYYQLIIEIIKLIVVIYMFLVHLHYHYRDMFQDNQLFQDNDYVNKQGDVNVNGTNESIIKCQ